MMPHKPNSDKKLECLHSFHFMKNNKKAEPKAPLHIQLTILQS